MSIKTKIAIIIIVIIAVLAGLVLVGQQLVPEEEEETETAQETEGAPLPQQYPDHLIEGIVKAVNLEERTLTLEARTSLIERAEKEVMEKTIKFTEETQWLTYSTISGEELPFEFSEIKAGDDIVVVTVESTFDKINKLEEFTASKINKMISE